MNRGLPNSWHRPIALSATLALAVLFFPPTLQGAEGETVFTFRPAESQRDLRYNFDTAVLQLALEKTKEKYGPYRLQASPSMTFPRAINSVSLNEYPNFFIKLSYEDRHVAHGHMTYARFPVDLGIVGYRICFTNPQAKERLRSIKTVDDLRQFTIGQGRGWADVEILRHNGFKVIEVSTYESLFKMVAAERFDLFCRGTNELLEEFETHRDIPGLTYDETFSVAYPLPRFYFTHESNRKAAERIEEGLLAAYRDGSLQDIWHKNYNNSIDFAQLAKRHFFWLENPLLEQIAFNYRQYFYDPFSQRKPLRSGQ